jgi:hypothetical protein
MYGVEDEMASVVLNIWVIAATAWVVACFCNNAVWTTSTMLAEVLWYHAQGE